jgi:heme-degrading monooxygenase HmoA
VKTRSQALGAPGVLRVELKRGPRNAFWTLTAWDTEASMRAFMVAQPHGTAMRKLMDWCDEASVVHWIQESAELPAWTEAHRRMQQEGRASKVNHPSPAHTAYKIEPPV